jgi:hypothetical protein
VNHCRGGAKSASADLLHRVVEYTAERRADVVEGALVRKPRDRPAAKHTFHMAEWAGECGWVG